MTAVPSALGDDLARGVAHVRRADVVVGIPSFKSAATIGHVASAVAGGLRERFAGARVAIVNADGGSNDGTTDRMREGAGDITVITGAYRGIPGKGTAVHAIFEVAVALGARTCAIVDSDLRSITPGWIAKLAGPIDRGEADYVAPLYLRDKHDGTITNTIAYPLTRALYGARVRQPIGGEFGFSGELARAFGEGGDWSSEIARFGIDIFMTTTALVRGARVVQAPLGAKVHDPKEPGADLGPMFVQVVGTVLALAADNADRWAGVRGSRPVPVIGDPETVKPEPLPLDPAAIAARFRATAEAELARWRTVLRPGSLDAVARAIAGDAALDRLEGAVWADVVYDFVAAAVREPRRCPELARSMLPLYYARVAALGREVATLDGDAAEQVIERQARAFEARKEHALR